MRTVRRTASPHSEYCTVLEDPRRSLSNGLRPALRSTSVIGAMAVTAPFIALLSGTRLASSPAPALVSTSLIALGKVSSGSLPARTAYSSMRYASSSRLVTVPSPIYRSNPTGHLACICVHAPRIEDPYLPRGLPQDTSHRSLWRWAEASGAWWSGRFRPAPKVRCEADGPWCVRRYLRYRRASAAQKSRANCEDRARCTKPNHGTSHFWFLRPVRSAPRPIVVAPLGRGSALRSGAGVLRQHVVAFASFSSESPINGEVT